MKTLNLLKSKNDQCRRKIVIAEINILINLDESHGSNNKKIVREMGKLHSLWFNGTSKDMRITESEDDSNSEQSYLI